ncbi:metalloregulator ArsR/SmtB family transcription factor [Nonomuraea sp. NBC_01738]|uniref:ArsR/SmtB family transcription factor n=1 Tax=Nonomuraea sp. NBC_01738 TaxID=2976003 RepID=UPI002E156DE5|nr:metalloregulator ArsR/SmtB family transcription factor [Nonomuraea sp. NBC_01738]
MSKQSLPVLDSGCCAPLVAELIDESEAAELARVFKALGDPIRLRLLSLIGAHEGGRRAGAGVCVCELTGAFEVTAPTISHHLKTLREAGLVGSERRGTWVYYWIVPATLKQLTGALALPDLLPDAPPEAAPRAAAPSSR